MGKPSVRRNESQWLGGDSTLTSTLWASSSGSKPGSPIATGNAVLKDLYVFGASAFNGLVDAFDVGFDEATPGDSGLAGWTDDPDGDPGPDALCAVVPGTDVVDFGHSIFFTKEPVIWPSVMWTSATLSERT